MKLFIASDIHGSELYLKKLIKCIETEKPERILLLGDLLYHGPRNALPDGYNPQAVAEILNDMKENIIAVRGNCEAEVDQMMLGFPCLADYSLIYADGITIFATHGHLYNEEKLPPLKKGDVLLNGHTHIPAIREYENYVYLNPGSVSIPKNGSSRGYMIYEDGGFIRKNLEGETENIYLTSDRGLI